MSTYPRGVRGGRKPPEPKAKGPARTPSFEEREIERFMKMTPAERAHDERVRRYREWRRQTRPFRRIMSGDFRDLLRLAQTTRLSLARDSVKVARVVEGMGGVEDVYMIADRAELPRGRVRACLKLLAQEATS